MGKKENTSEVEKFWGIEETIRGFQRKQEWEGRNLTPRVYSLWFEMAVLSECTLACLWMLLKNSSDLVKYFR